MLGFHWAWGHYGSGEIGRRHGSGQCVCGGGGVHRDISFTG